MLSLASEFLPRVRRDEPMSRHTSWHVGGPADVYFTPSDRADLAAFLRVLPPPVPVYWVGLGSNLLVRDGGISGVVISVQGGLDRLERIGPETVWGEAGVACARIARQCLKWSLGSAEFFAGIPGTLGGALAMNAGAFGGETWRQVLSVETIDRAGREHTRAAGEYRVSYRHVEPPAAEEWFLAATLRFAVPASASGRCAESDATPQTSAACRVDPIEPMDVQSLLGRRRATQPIGEWSCGSVFTNPPGDHAARLIDAAGLKGARIGGASVSLKHANFIINHGAASAGDIESLIRHVQTTVEQVHGVRLTPEVRIVGESVRCA